MSENINSQHKMVGVVNEQSLPINLQSRRVGKALRSKRNVKGFTLIELSIVIIVGALLLAVALVIARSVLADNRANDELKELPVIITRVQKLYANRPNFAGLTTTLAIAQNVFPDSRVASTTTVNNRWGGTITMAPVTIASANDAVDATYTLVPKSECLAVIPQVENNMRTITVGGTVVKADGALTDLTALGTQCGTSPTTIVYRFSK